jgi:hypothetical protein
MRLSYTNETRTFLESHTKTNIGGVSSTYRDSKRAPFEWRFKLSAAEVDYVQRSCRDAMTLWGYRPMELASKIANKSADELEQFWPLVPGFKLPFSSSSEQNAVRTKG